METRKRKKYAYLSAIIGAAGMTLLRFWDKASVFSAVLVIVAMAALVYSVRHAATKKEYICIAGSMVLAFAVRIYGYTGYSVMDMAIGVLTGLILFALLCAERLAKKWENQFWYTILFPAVYLLFLYFTEIVKINMPFRMDTYLSSIPVLCQITALFGIYALDFLLAWTASVLVYFIDHRAAGQSGKLAIVYAAVLCAILCFGFAHRNEMNAQESEKDDTVRVACATGPYHGSLLETSYVDYTLKESLVSLTGIVQNAAKENAEILLLCEEAYAVTDTEEDAWVEEAKKLAEKNEMHLLLAYEVDDTDGSEDGKSINKLCWISSEGEILYDYTKHCIIPLIETFTYVRGDKNIEAFSICVHGKALTVATAICYDTDFDFFMSHMGENVDLLLLPTWDWEVIAEEHFSVARLRAIASETTVIRSVYDGWSAVIDSAGNVLLRENTNDIGYENVLVYDVPIR